MYDVCVRACVRACVSMYVCVCVCACARVCMYACVVVWLCGRVVVWLASQAEDEKETKAQSEDVPFSSETWTEYLYMQVPVRRSGYLDHSNRMHSIRNIAVLYIHA